MRYENIVLEIHAGVARLMLNRPDKLNSFNRPMQQEMLHALARVEADSGVRVLLLTGAGRAFCAGQDLLDPAVQVGSDGVDLGVAVQEFYAPLVLTLQRLPLPVVCAVNGVAAGAGANLALAADIVIAGKSASFVEAFCKLGLVPDTGGTWFLPRLVGSARASGFALLGNKLSAERAEQWGLIWQVVPDAQLMIEANALVSELASAPTLGLGCTKRALQLSSSQTLTEQLALEGQMMRELGRTYDYREGVAAFIARRTPDFKGV